MTKSVRSGLPAIGKPGSNKDKMTRILFDVVEDAESFPTSFREWLRLIPRDHSLLPKSYKDKTEDQLYTVVYSLFSDPKDSERLWQSASNLRLQQSAGKVTALLERLWGQGMQGDVPAAREYLTRILGSPQQNVLVSHTASSELASLLSELKPSDAYKQPQLTGDDEEIIEVEVQDGEATDATSEDQ